MLCCAFPRPIFAKCTEAVALATNFALALFSVLCSWLTCIFSFPLCLTPSGVNGAEANGSRAHQTKDKDRERERDRDRDRDRGDAHHKDSGKAVARDRDSRDVEGRDRDRDRNRGRGRKEEREREKDREPAPRKTSQDDELAKKVRTSAVVSAC